MRHPFIFNVSDYKAGAKCIGTNGLYWEELRSWSHALPLHSFFKDVLAVKERRLSQEDGHDWRMLSKADKARYLREAHDMIFKLREFKWGINRLIPAAAAVGFPSFVRRRQRERDVRDGMLGRHFGVLCSDLGRKRILGFVILDRVDHSDEAELSYWKCPYLDGNLFLKSVEAFMLWSRQAAGYRHFKIHIQATTDNQRGNPASVHFAEKLNFQISGVRKAEEKPGNGKETLILTARNWVPRIPTCTTAPTPPW